MKQSPSETIETTIDGLAAGGDGVGRTADGRVLFVPLTVPGDRIRARVVTSKKRFVRGVVEEILVPSPHRVDPVCPFYGICGGCSWQQVDYPEQVAAKATIVRDALTRIGHFELEAPIPITPSPAPYGYRNRARLLQVGTRIGYRMRRSHDVCGVDRCAVLSPALERALSRLAGSAKPHERGEPDEWEISVGVDGTTQTNRVGARRGPGDFVTMSAGSDPLRISAGVFAQGNALLMEALVQAVTREAGVGASLVELFAGAGLFTIALSRRFDWVFALESNGRAVEDLRFNLATAARTNVDVRAGRVEQTLAQLDLSTPDVVVLDPPRTGVPPGTLSELAGLAPVRIVYLSCDPATLARDLARLRVEGYRLTHVEAFDLFPQTPHVETLATLVRAAGR